MPKTVNDLVKYLKSKGITEKYFAVYPQRTCPAVEEYVAIKPEGDKWRVISVCRDEIIEENVLSEEAACKDVLLSFGL